jgi:hypothetical protein
VLTYISAPFQHLDVEVARRRKPLRYGVRRRLPLREQGSLILANVLESQPVEGAMKLLLAQPHADAFAALQAASSESFAESSREVLTCCVFDMDGATRP